MRRRQARVIDTWQNAGWDLVREEQGRFRTKLTFRKQTLNRRWVPWIATSIVLALVLGVLAFVLLRTASDEDRLAQVRADASAAVRALQSGDLTALDQRLAAHRGQSDFAYFFTSQTTPRELGDAVATVAGSGANAPFKAGVDTDAYGLALTDLAGTLALATYGTGDQALPRSWTNDFVEATTTPEVLYSSESTASASRSPEAATSGASVSAVPAQVRADQDVANRQNLLLLLARGYWSTDFLEAVTAAYWDYDRAKGTAAWPTARLDDAKYAPAPNGAYLTDGVLALTAALTANPAASKWAFTDFQPGSSNIAGSDYAVGTFTHYLLFEHRFPQTSHGESIGMTATLTALSSAIDAIYGPAAARAAAAADPSSTAAGPLHDSIVLQAVARGVTGGSGCSWNPLDYLHCASAAAKAVWHWVQHWGHTVLDILSLATFAPPPFDIVGVGAAATNATWYVVDGDYAMAGLSLAAAVPGLAFGKIAKGVKAGVVAEKGTAAAGDLEKTVAQSDEIATAAKEIRAGAKVSTARELAEAGASRIEKSPKPTYARERQAQEEFASEIPGARMEETLDPGCAKTCTGVRHVDIFDPKTGACIEIKKGSLATNRDHEMNEIAKDLMLLKNKKCATVEWRFVPDADGNVGPYDPLRTTLQEKGIPYAMYLP